MIPLTESVDVSQDAMVVEVKEGMVEGDVHHRLFSEGIPTDRLLASADIGAGKKVDHIAWLPMPHSPIQGWFS